MFGGPFEAVAWGMCGLVVSLNGICIFQFRLQLAHCYFPVSLFFFSRNMIYLGIQTASKHHSSIPMRELYCALVCHITPPVDGTCFAHDIQYTHVLYVPHNNITYRRVAPTPTNARMRTKPRTCTAVIFLHHFSLSPLVIAIISFGVICITITSFW
jgi:hypothetical protein